MARRQDENEDLYAVLGVAPDASDSCLRKAYHRLALRHHPDHTGDADGEHIQRINDAYGVLSDPAARARYDRRCACQDLPRPPGPSPRRPAASTGRSSGPAAEPLRSPGRAAGPAGWSTARPPRARADARPAADHQLLLPLSPTQARRGGPLLLRLPLVVACPECGGASPPWIMGCARCGGSGRIQLSLRLQLTLPPHVRDGQVFDLELRGVGTVSLRVATEQVTTNW